MVGWRLETRVEFAFWELLSWVCSWWMERLKNTVIQFESGGRILNSHSNLCFLHVIVPPQKCLGEVAGYKSAPYVVD